MKIDEKKLKMACKGTGLHNPQKSGHTSGAIKVTGHLADVLNAQPVSGRVSVKVDLMKMRELGLYKPYRLPLGRLAAAACLVLAVGVFLFPLRFGVYAFTNKSANDMAATTCQIDPFSSGTIHAAKSATIAGASKIKTHKIMADVSLITEAAPEIATVMAVEVTQESAAAEEPVSEITQEAVSEAAQEPASTEIPVEEPGAEIPIEEPEAEVPIQKPAATIPEITEPEIVTEPAAVPETAEMPVQENTDDEWVSLGDDWTITYYCPLSCCNGSHPWLTSTGSTMQTNHTIAVDPAAIPYYTHVRIGGHDYEYVAEDCGGAIKGHEIDVLVENCSLAKQLGKQHNVEVWVKRQ